MLLKIEHEGRCFSNYRFHWATWEWLIASFSQTSPQSVVSPALTDDVEAEATRDQHDAEASFCFPISCLVDRGVHVFRLPARAFTGIWAFCFKPVRMKNRRKHAKLVLLAGESARPVSPHKTGAA